MTNTIACECGNAVLPRKCCSLPISSKPWTGIPKKIKVKQAIAQIVQLLQQRNYSLVELSANSILKKIPNHPPSLYLLGLSAFYQNNLSRASTLIEQAFSVGYRDAAAHLNYANIIGQQGDAAQALLHLEKAVKLQPNFIQAFEMGYQLAMQEQDVKKAISFAKGLSFHKAKDVESWLKLSDAYHLALNDDLSLESLEKGLEISPENTELLLRKAGILELRHLLDDAMMIVIEVLQEQPNSVPALLLQTRVLRRQGNIDKSKVLLTKLESLVADKSLDSILVAQEKVELFQLTSQYQEQWESAIFVNQMSDKLLPSSGNFTQKEQQLSEIEQLSFNLSKTNNTVDKPGGKALFIMGFPRVGSTLIEKLIHTKFQTTTVGESNAINKAGTFIGKSAGQPWWRLSEEQWSAIDVEKAISSLRGCYGDSFQQSPIVDKNLFNVHCLPVIQTILPDSVLLYLVRHPLDVFVSCFLTRFGSHDGWHRNLKDIANYMLRTHLHWLNMREKLVLPYIEVKYEELIMQGELTPSINEFLLEHWCSTLRDKDESSHFETRTASYAQVKEPMHQKSVGRYRKYIEFIPADIIEILRPLIEYYDYDVEKN